MHEGTGRARAALTRLALIAARKSGDIDYKEKDFRCPNATRQRKRCENWGGNWGPAPIIAGPRQDCDALPDGGPGQEPLARQVRQVAAGIFHHLDEWDPVFVHHDAVHFTDLCRIQIGQRHVLRLFYKVRSRQGHTFGTAPGTHSNPAHVVRQRWRCPRPQRCGRTSAYDGTLRTSL